MPYKCGRCGYEITDLREFESIPGMRCPQCNYRIFYKVRPPIVKRLKV
ncbi:MAG: DNA-directed RNA polymerase subunit P [Candidatus Methanomethylicota archaeon]|uniref:DNA-directed RNA polymerase subunit Rpo12 n=1 Tax=Thermoproteota archaeon TaxID=2056631 RepID=A0A497F5J0_9CREN|nr:MAG: DNA-directed RNA polymerase subunit P [Candidatus Verstraetearchaeota archaeon]RLE54571.1 MAG: DNA-directed RNA polymerase subunit P [Candidatus Verstraetearchaeota archaeon]RLI19061.1 MAG: DNA-directed RNA polymerase subunit P [Candidatus Bathyarchaeota archaeon]